MSFVSVFLLSGGIVLFTMTSLWVVSLTLRDSSIVDIFWGLGFVLLAWVYFAFTPGGFTARKWLLCLLVTLWGLRLSLYILWRNWGQGEDYRYRRWRGAAGGRWWWQSYFKVFLLQGFLLWLISAPLLAAQIPALPGEITPLELLGVVLWAIGFLFEAGGDLQLALFREEPSNAGRVFDGGLWRFTRHPNYFGDAVQWWAFFLFALAAGAWWTIFSPLLMTFLLVRVSGVSMLEGDLVERKPGYAEYIQRTSAFFPWFPKEPS